MSNDNAQWLDRLREEVIAGRRWSMERFGNCDAHTQQQARAWYAQLQAFRREESKQVDAVYEQCREMMKAAAEALQDVMPCRVSENPLSLTIDAPVPIPFVLTIFRGPGSLWILTVDDQGQHAPSALVVPYEPEPEPEEVRIPIHVRLADWVRSILPQHPSHREICLPRASTPPDPVDTFRTVLVGFCSYGSAKAACLTALTGQADTQGA